MGKLENKYTEDYIVKNFVDNLEEDGAICDYYSSYYKEIDTYNGGQSDRLQFKKVNDKINSYHNILKNLTGEVRANIYEDIPAIDFLKPEYTGFMYTYEKTPESTDPIDPTSIVAIPIEDGKTALERLVENDSATINRALSADPIAEHFYNTVGVTSSENNIQVSPYESKPCHVFNGILSPPIMEKGVVGEFYRKSPMYFYEINSDEPFKVYFTPVDEEDLLIDASTVSKLVKITGGEILVRKLFAVDVPKEKTDNIILNTIDVLGSWSPQGVEKGSMANQIENFTHDGANIIGEEKRDSLTLYYINVVKGDILVSLPKDTDSIDNNRLLILKKNTNPGKVAKKYEATYVFYKNGEYYTQYDAESPNNVKLAPVEGNYYYYDDENGNYVYVNYAGNEYIEVYRQPARDDGKDYSSFTVEVAATEYSCYVLFLNGFNTAFSMSSSFTKVDAGTDITFLTENVSLYNILSKYISIALEYRANASGLLDGYFCEPVEYEQTNGCSDAKVKRWRFIDETKNADGSSNSIDIGTRFHKNHLLNRGEIKDAPLALTKSDVNDDNKYKGKASLIYDSISDSNLTESIFKIASVPNWDSIPVKTLDSVLTKLDYSKSADYTKEYTASIRGGESSTAVSMKYADKLYKDGKPLSYEAIDKYITTFFDSIDGSALTLDMDDAFVTSDFKIEAVLKGCAQDQIDSREEVNKTSRADLANNCNVGFKVKYDVRIKGKKNDYYDGNFSSMTLENGFKNPDLDFVTPMELFSEKGKNANTVLVFPEYDNYFPDYVYLMSKVDLGLEPIGSDKSTKKRSTCSFVANDGTKVLVFNVVSRNSFVPSEIKTLRVLNVDTEHKGKIPEYNVNIEALPGWNNWGCRLTRCTDSEIIDRTKLYGCQYPYYWINDYGEEEGISLSQMTSWLNNAISDLGPGASAADIKKATEELLFEYHVKEPVVDRNCYVYKLGYFDSSIIQNNDSYQPIYDWNDNEIQLDNSRSKIVGLAYPDSYFKTVEKEEDGIITHEIASTDRLNSFKNLKNSYIIAGMPEFDEADDLKLKNIVPGEVTFGVVSDFINANNESSISNNLIKSILWNWPISTSSDDPIYLKDLPGILKSIIDLADETGRMADSSFRVLSKGNLIALNRDSFKNLREVVNNGTDEYHYNIKINSPRGTSSYNKCFKKGSGYSDIVEGRLKELSIDNITVTEMNGKPATATMTHRDSIRNLYSATKSLIEGTFNKSLCESIDTYFGNGTNAFLTIGDSYLVSNENISYTPRLQAAEDKIREEVTEIVYDSFMYQCREKADKALNGVEIDGTWTKGMRDIVREVFDNVTDDNVYLDGATLVINTSTMTPKLDCSNSICYEIYSIVKREYDPQNDRGLLGKVGNFLFKNNSLWSKYGVQDFIQKFIVEEYNGTGEKNLILNAYKEVFDDRFMPIYISNFNKNALYPELDKKAIRNYFDVGVSNSATSDPLSVAVTTNNRIKVMIVPPVITVTDEGAVELSDPRDADLNYSPITITFFKYVNDKIDIEEGIMYGLVDFIKTSLQGTNPNGNNENYYVKYVEGDKTPSGRQNSLYYKRYNILNRRMNRIQGPLWKASSMLRNSKQLNSISVLNQTDVESSKSFIEVMPISSIEPLTYMPTAPAAMTDTILPGKLYSDSELSKMRELINSRCVLTCTKCSIKDDCPYYNQEEVIKMYCEGAESIDLWVKDNKLDLIHYDEEDLSPYLNSDSNSGVDIDNLKKVHLPYEEIKKRQTSDGSSKSYSINDLQDVRDSLAQQPNLRYGEYVKDDMGWLLGARYGTVQKNSVIDLIDEDNEFYTRKGSIHPYKYMYDAMFIGDEESYIEYSPSTHRYDVKFTTGISGSEESYSGSTKILYPTSLTILKDANPNDDVYLASDDKRDANGNAILPLIYLGKAGNIELAFDLTDDGIAKGLTDPEDKKIYAADVAQWCINYYKGNCALNPIGETKEGIPDNYSHRDQYWMETVYKEIDGNWIALPGRKRVLNGYGKMLLDSQDFDEVLTVSGRPLVANYVDFVRKVSIKVYDKALGEWTIPWINESLPIDNSASYFKGLDTIEQKKERQREVLPLMKTNLRLCLVKSN